MENVTTADQRFAVTVVFAADDIVADLAPNDVMTSRIAESCGFHEDTHIYECTSWRGNNRFQDMLSICWEPWDLPFVSYITRHNVTIEDWVNAHPREHIHRDDGSGHLADMVARMDSRLSQRKPLHFVGNDNCDLSSPFNDFTLF